ncbi:dihydroorotate oxidase [Elizabethkingia anophelis]|uniref:Dihydroorotate dehydrogenase n=2 Tax=Elizabethkingia anophelis TaxID=1117645 RepID=X5KEV1_9FLAO|nr:MULTISPECIES: dihydroorotate oxidase [Elizabethkingia]AKH93048.1 dihydroorotate dehydrogenase [Elizabethkingia anophelis FMS-007]AMR42562.1 dihydroorotate oxidase [Elizabethkingia anophelis]AMX52660.1 dihydroorotate oxidase [Elizabethkingia anophelis]AMX56051.1 dihydroorotate oxidase [Elizabethkingia anophelis]AQW90295.1 dihydroorotate oxidase [Elizabethkingia anophelis]
MNLTSRIANYEFENPFMNASGVMCYDEMELDQLLRSSAGAFVTKSATPDFREGNPSPRYVDVPLGSINSMGLPNKGFDFYLNFSINFQNENPGKINFISIAGMSMEDNLEMLQKINDSDFKGITELNLSCPNVPGKPQVGYDFERTEEVLTKAFEFFQKPIGVKLPPYFDIAHFDQMAEILNKFPLQYVNCINSIGNGLYIDVDHEEVVIKPKDGFGGIGGAYVKPTALANVRAFYTRLNSDIAVIGCGGVENGKDAFEHLLCGAQMVQVGTQLMKEGAGAFDRILEELKAIMQEKGYTSIEDFRGKLKSL